MNDYSGRCEHGLPACPQCRPHPWRPWHPLAWKPEPFKGACGDCGKAKAAHIDGSVVSSGEGGH